MELSFYITAFVTLFVVIDPIGLTPIFVALTSGMPTERRKVIARRSVLISAILLTLFGVFGEAVLEFVGISMPAFQIAGGILLFLTALDMLFERRTERRQGQAEEPGDDPSVFPLAIPLIAGPGAIATMILLTGQTGGDWTAMILIHLVLFSLLLLTFALFRVSGLLEHAIGATGVNVVTRLLGMLLAALSVQFVVDGVRALGLVAA